MGYAYHIYTAKMTTLIICNGKKNLYKQHKNAKFSKSARGKSDPSLDLEGNLRNQIKTPTGTQAMPRGGTMPCSSRASPPSL
jgi:hypothetical protein